MRGAGVDRRVVRDARLAAGGLELVDRALRNALVGAAEDRQDGARVAGDRVDGLGPVRPAPEPEWPAVEPDHAGVPEPAGGLEVRERPAEAEADREERAHLAARGAAQVRGRGRDVGLKQLGPCLRDLGHEVEALATVGRGRCAREEIDGHRVHTDLGEAIG